MARGRPGSGVEACARVKNDGQGEGELEPGQSMRHAENQDRRGKQDGHQQAPPIARFRGIGRRLGFWNAVTQVFDGADEIAHADAVGIVFHGGGVGGQVDASAFHAGGGGERPLDGAGAGGAGHAGDRQVHALGCGDVHAGTS